MHQSVKDESNRIIKEREKELESTIVKEREET